MKKINLFSLALFAALPGLAQMQSATAPDFGSTSKLSFAQPQHESVFSLKTFSHGGGSATSFRPLRTSPPQDSGIYGGLYVGVKTLPLKTESGTISLSYTDESPSRDHFSSSRQVDASSTSFNIDIGIEGGRKNGHHWELLFGGSFGDLLVRFYAQLGYGRNFSISKDGRLWLRPVLNLSYGNLRYKLGDMTQNSIYIQVNGKEFHSEKVAVAAVTNPLAFIPRLDIPFAINKKKVIKFHIGYHLTLMQTDPFIRFKGEDESEESLTEREKITESNINLKINGRPIRKMPVELDGLTFGIGICL